MSSPNNSHGQSSSPMIRHRSLDKLQQFGSIRLDSTWNGGLLSSGQRSTAQAVQLANQFQQLQVKHHHHTDIASTQATVPTADGGPSTLISSHLQNESSLVEEDLIERLKELINEFMTRPGRRRYEYNTTMRWTVDHGNEINYSVVILINQPSELI